MFKKNHKKLAKLIAAAFSLNSLGCTIVPVMASAATAPPSAPWDDVAVSGTEQGDVAVSTTENYYKHVMSRAAASGITLNDSDDDLTFINKVLELCSKASDDPVSETFKDLIVAAEEEQEEVEAKGKTVSAFAQSILNAKKRISRIADDIKKSGTLNFDVSDEEVIAHARKTYQKGMEAKQLCEKEARETGKDTSACVLSEETKQAANILLTRDIQQVNATATSPATTNAMEQKGASTIKNKDSHWKLDPETGLWYEDTNETEITCGDGEVVIDDKCVKVTPTCKENEELKDGKCVTKETAPTCKEDEKLVDGKCELNCADGYEAKDGKCVEITCGDNQELKDGKCVDKVVCAADETLGEDGKCAKIDCGDGKVLKDGKCVDKETTEGVCEPFEEYDKENGKCACPESRFMFHVPRCKENEEAVMEKTSHGCDSGYTCVKRCGEGEAFDSSTGTCSIIDVVPPGPNGPIDSIIPICEDGEEMLADGSCAAKCAETEERVNGSCVAKCASDEERKDGACVKKEKCTSGYVESNGQCCPSDQPSYNTSKGVCEKPESTTVETASGTPAAGEEEGGKKKNDTAGILGGLAALGAIGAAFGHHGDNGGRENLQDNSLQYAFNYCVEGSAADGTCKNIKGAKHLFPQNSQKDVLFKLFQYKIPAATDANGKPVQPKAWVTFPVPMRDASGKVTLQTMDMPIELNKVYKLFPETISDKDETFTKLKQYGVPVRIPASEFNKKFYTMTVTADDGVKGHTTEFNIYFDFATESTVIGNADQKLKKGTNVVEGHKPSITMDAIIAGAEWDDATKTCRINITGGAFVDADADEGHYDENNTYTVTSDRYKESGCTKINAAAGEASIHMQGLTTSDDGKGHVILSDKDVTEARISIYRDAGEFKNDGTMDYKEGILSINDVKAEYQSEMTYYERRPVSFKVTYADGHEEEWKGYSSDGTNLYDTDGNPLTESQKEKEAKLVCDVTGNPEVCNEGVKFDACSANHEPDRLGMVCLFKKDGTEVEYSPQGFDRNSVGLVGGVSKTDSENSAIDGMFGRGNHSNTSSITAAAKTFYQTATGQDVLTGNDDSKKTVPVDGYSGTSETSGVNGSQAAAGTSTGKPGTSGQNVDGGWTGMVQDAVNWGVNQIDEWVQKYGDGSAAMKNGPIVSRVGTGQDDTAGQSKEVYSDNSATVYTDGQIIKASGTGNPATGEHVSFTPNETVGINYTKKMTDYLARVAGIPGLTQTKAVEIFQQHRNESLDDLVRLTKATFDITD